MLKELKAGIERIRKRIEELRGYLDVARRSERIAALEKEVSNPNFWNDHQNTSKTIKELKNLKSAIEPFGKLERDVKELSEIAEIAEASDGESLTSFIDDLKHIEKALARLEFTCLLSDEDDRSDAIVSINAGAGGTESCDWAGMLLRMYTKWSESRRFTIQRLDYLPGEEAGVKNVTVLVKGNFAYGYLKGEIGVHRLVRISPFDANKRRHTSFASVDVIPEVSDEIKIAIKESDLKIDTYRASGKGGQHVNVTDSAVRITHVPTGIVAQCQNERSQFKNKSMAIKILKARLHEREKLSRTKKIEQAYEAKKEIAWGSQIRSYVLHPYSMVKDHRTGCETSDSQGVLDGDIDDFTEAYLKFTKSPKE
ncbi:peptide chain release factor 2 [Candidatus Omnitrophota bacterium]